MCFLNYTFLMRIEVRQTETFRKWRKNLKDRRALFSIASRLDRLALGYMGDVRSVGDGISEMRIHHGPGYRIYFQKHENVLIILLCAGDKSSQNNDIKRAKKLAKMIWE